MLVVFPPIFVADTKILCGYNFITPLTLMHDNQKYFKKNTKISLIKVIHLFEQ